MAETNGTKNNIGYVYDNIKKLTGQVKVIYSDAGESDTVSSTRHDTAGSKICKIYFATDGALKSLTCTAGYFVNSSDVDSATTYTAGAEIWVKDVTKVQTSTHGTQMIYLNE
jgi:hypothetical protein